MKILVVEDDKEIQSLIGYFFSEEGFEVSLACDGMEGLKKIKNENFDLLVLDRMLPNLDGEAITKLVRDMPEIYGTPKIIMVTAKTEIEDVLTGLKVGADDYLKKPFDPRELVARGKKLIEKNMREEAKGKIKVKNKKKIFHNLVIDEDIFSVKIDGEEVEFSKKEFYLLLMLVINVGIVITREKILDTVWETNYSIGDRTVDVYIGKIREKIGELGSCIRTIKGVGYKLDAKRE